jgi:hypothetical protein
MGGSASLQLSFASDFCISPREIVENQINGGLPMSKAAFSVFVFFIDLFVLGFFLVVFAIAPPIHVLFGVIDAAAGI